MIDLLIDLAPAWLPVLALLLGAYVAAGAFTLRGIVRLIRRRAR